MNIAKLCGLRFQHHMGIGRGAMQIFFPRERMATLAEAAAR